MNEKLSEYYEAFLMRENIELSHGLLTMIADEPEWPSRYRKADYMAAFPDRSKPEIAFHLDCLVKAGLVDGRVELSKTRSSSPMDFEAFIQGLTSKGDTYLKDVESKTSPVYKMAYEMLIKKNIEITTGRLAIATQGMVDNMLSSV